IGVATRGNPTTFLPLEKRPNYLPAPAPVPVPVPKPQTSPTGLGHKTSAGNNTNPPGEQVQTPRPKLGLPDVVEFEDYAYLDAMGSDWTPEVCLGVGDYQNLYFKLDSHVLLAGASRSGKSTALYTLVQQLLWGKNAKLIQLALIDLGGVTFNHPLFAGLPQVWGQHQQVAKSEEEAIALLQELVLEKRRREQLFSQSAELGYGIDKLATYNRAIATYNRELQISLLETSNNGGGGQTLAYLPYLKPIVCIIEEMSTLADQAREKLLSPLRELAWQGLKCGIILVNAGQDFREKTTDSAIVRNSYYRFMFGETDSETRRTLKFRPEAVPSAPHTKGRGMAHLPGKPVQEFQGIYLSKEDFVKRIVELRRQAGLLHPL
ncbi:MAG: FtsK/SpoIIIE domain-containing protein, partial [Chloroflexota bacterium]